MIRLTLPLSLLPAGALAHGAHAPVPDLVHGAAHLAGPGFAALMVIALAAYLIARTRP